MTIVTGILIFIVGAIAGFILNKFTGASSQENKKLSEQVSVSEQALEKYKSNVAEHLETSAQLLDQMHNTCKEAIVQMSQSTKLLQEATPEEASAMPFFSKETQEQLAQTVQLRRQSTERSKDIEITEAPLDYSGDPSGIFDNSTQNVTKPNKEGKELS